MAEDQAVSLDWEVGVDVDSSPDPTVVESYRVDLFLVDCLGEDESLDSVWVLCEG